MKSLFYFGVVGALSLGSIAKADEGLVVARHSTNQLVLHVHDPLPIRVERSVVPGIPGYATGLHGFHSIDLVDEEEDLQLLSDNADVRVVLAAKDTGARLYNGLTELNVGDHIPFGPAPFDFHPLFVVDPSVAHGTAVGVTVVLHDQAGLYTDSDPFEITLTPACPADFGGQGGLFGPDGVHDNNDFVVFINFFFAGSAFADVGTQGGAPGRDGVFDNNDFVVFINDFFTPCV